MVLDEAVAAVALERLGDGRHRALADPVLRDRGSDAPQETLGPLVFAARGGKEAEHEPGRGRAFEVQVGDDVRHHGLVDEALLEGPPVAHVVRRLRHRLAHDAGRGERAFEAREVSHGDRIADAVPLLADEGAVGAPEFHLGGCVRLVAGLVLQPLHEEAVIAPVRQRAGQEEAGHLALDLREREEAI